MDHTTKENEQAVRPQPDAVPTASSAASPALIHKEHQSYLSKRAVPLEFAYGARIHSVTGEEAGELLERQQRLLCGGLAIPYGGTKPLYVRIRVDEPEAAEGARYLAPAGREIPVYIPWQYFDGSAAAAPSPLPPLFVVESPIKALALAAAGHRSVGLGGTGTTLTTDGEVRRLNSSWSNIPLKDRAVVIVFDAGRATNPNVARDEARLASALSAAGAKVSVAALPLTADGRDQGPDDFLALNGPEALRAVIAAARPADPLELGKSISQGGEMPTAAKLLDDLPFLVACMEGGLATTKLVFAELAEAGIKPGEWRTALSAAKKKMQPAAASQRRADVGGIEYGEDGGRLCIVTHGDGGEESYTPLCNFTAKIEEENILDDGVEETREVILKGRLANGDTLAPARMRVEGFMDHLWPLQLWGTRAQTAADASASAHTRLAIQQRSFPAQKRVFTHTGWRETDDGPIFLHAGGAVGDSEVKVQLDGALARYSLPAKAVDVVEAVRFLVSLLGLAPAEVTFPLLATVLHAPIQSLLYSSFALFLVGKTGSLKTSLANLFVASFGEALAERAVTSFDDSISKIEAVLFAGMDVAVLLDDFKPKSTHTQEDMRVKAQVIFSCIGNGEGRGRMRSDGSPRPNRPPRAQVIATGEVLPEGESTVARVLPIELRREMVKLEALSAAQAQAHRLPHAMLGYVNWLRPRLTEVKQRLPEEFRSLRAKFLEGGGGHLRSPAMLAHLALSLRLFSEFCQECGALDAAGAKRLVGKGICVFETLRSSQTVRAQQADPAQRFLEVLRDLVVRGKALLEADMQKPLGRYATSQIGENIGWEDKERVYLLEEATYQLVVRSMGEARETMPLPSRVLWRRLRELGAIEAGDEPDRNTRRPSLGGGRPHVIVMPRTVIDGPEEPDGGGGSPAVPPTPPDPAPPTGDNVDFGDSEGSGDQASKPADRGNESADRANLPENWGRKSDDWGRAASGVPSDDDDIIEEVYTTTTEKSKTDPVAPVVGGRGYVRENDSTPESPKSDDVEVERIEVPSPRGTGATGSISSNQSDSDPNSAAQSANATGRVGQPGPVIVHGALTALESSAPQGPYICTATAARLLAGTGKVAPSVKVAWKAVGGDPNAHPSPAELWARQEPELAAQGLTRVAQLEFDLLPAVASMQVAGVGIDAAAWSALVDQRSVEVASLRQRIAVQLGVKNPDHDAEVLAALKQRGLKIHRTSGETLAPFKKVPVVADLLQYRPLASFMWTLGTSVQGALTRCSDGRIHATFDPLGAATGRFGVSDPPLLQMPKNPMVRRCIVPALGCVFIDCDYSAIDLRVLADVTGDECLIGIFKGGGDPHRQTAAVILNKKPEKVTKDERQRAKAVNFGLAFGMGEQGLIDYARKDYGVIIEPTEAARFKLMYLDAYKGIKSWQEKMRVEMPRVVRTASGRLRRFADRKSEYCERLSTAVQGSAADGMKRALILLHKRLPALGARLVLCVHDEMLVEAPIEGAEKVRITVEEAMIEGMAEFVRAVPIKVESSVRKSWAE